MPMLQGEPGPVNEGQRPVQASQESVGKLGLSSGLLKLSPGHVSPGESRPVFVPEPRVWERKTRKVLENPHILLPPVLLSDEGTPVQGGCPSSGNRNVTMGHSWVPTALWTEESQNVRDVQALEMTNPTLIFSDGGNQGTAWGGDLPKVTQGEPGVSKSSGWPPEAEPPRPSGERRAGV